MFSRRYLHSHFPTIIGAFTLLLVCVSVLAENDPLISATIQNETDSSGELSEGLETGTTTSNEGLSSAESTTIPALSDSLFSSATTTDQPSSAEKPVVTVLPSSFPIPPIIVTSTKISLDHRLGLLSESSAEVNEGITESPSKAVEESSTDASTIKEVASEKATVFNEVITPQVTPKHSHRKSRYHRYHESFAQDFVAEPEANPIGLTGFHDIYKDIHDASTEYYKEMEVEGTDSYGDLEDNDIPEQLPTPMALINPNGEGNNPPLEDDFAEAFKKVNSHGKRRRFRGGRRGRTKLKKANDTNDSNTSGSSNLEQEDAGSKASASEWSIQSTTVTPSTAQPTKFKRYRSTTPNSIFVRSSTTPSSIPTEPPPSDGSPVIKKGPKPMILHNTNGYDEINDVTPIPQIEKPGNGGHTEKISTYFFSTPSPSARLRLRQKIRESLPTSFSTTTSTTETPSQSVDPSSFHSGNDAWNNQFSELPQNPFYSDTSNNFKIPEFVPMDLGVEPDDKQEPVVENSLAKPDSAEKKTYSLGHQISDSSSTNHGHYDIYSDSSTTPKSQRIRRPSSTAETYSSSPNHGYDASMHVAPTTEVEKAVGTGYYSEGQHTEPSTSYPSSTSHRSASGSHYDRTKDKVIFYNNSPYSAQHSSTVGMSVDVQAVAETTPGTASQTVGSHLSVSEGPSIYDSTLNSAVTIDHHHYPSATDGSMYTRGHVYSGGDVSSPLESTFKNGPPDSSHIHSPNIVENAPQTIVPAPTDADNSEYHPHHHHNNHNHQDTYSQTYFEDSHRPAEMPGGSSAYGTVEEVPPHNSPTFEHAYHSPHHQYHPNHNPPQPPSPNHLTPYPFDHPRSPPHAPAMSYSPHNTIPLPPPPHHHEEHSLPTHPIPPPPLPPPPPLYNHAPPHYSQHHPHQHADVHNSFAPPYEFHSSDNSNVNNQPDSHLIPNHVANNPSGLRPDEISSVFGPPHGEHPDGDSSGASSSPTSASPPEFPLNLLSNGEPESTDPQAMLNGMPPPPPPPSHLDPNFPSHSHTMATLPDYEPANPPLPHDHPFHNSFIPFPPSDLQQQLDHNSHDTNTIGAAPDGSGGQYHPGIVENVPTGRPSSFEASPLIPAKFTPIPDDVKDNELYNSFANKPYDAPGSHPETSEGSLSSNPIDNVHQTAQHHQHHHPHDHMSTYLSSTGDETSSYQHHPSQMDSFGGDHPGKGSGYSGPVNEIHSGIYHHPNIDPALSEHGENYPEHHHHHDIGSLDHSHNSPDYNMHGDSGHPDYKTGGMNELQKPLHEEHDGLEHHHQHHGGGSDGKKEKKRQQAFSNTPYVLMFPQLIPEEKMRPSPPPVLAKEIPVVQASSINDYASSGEKPPLGPGFKAVPVHPRHQMYQVLAKTHYEKMMERYKESKRKPPSAIYTPYGILVPVGTNVDAAASMNHNVFSKPRLHPKFRGEKSLINALLGSHSSNHGRFHPPMMGNRLTKTFEYEPAIDMLAEKLAMKIVNAQHVLNSKSSKMGSQGSYLGHKTVISEKSDGKSEESDLTSPLRMEKEDPQTMESKVHAVMANPELKDYLKGVLKGHLTEMVETSVSMEDRRPVTLSSKLLNSFFRKSRVNINQPPKSPSMAPILMPSASMMMSNKVPPPPGMQTQPSPHHHPGIGHPFPPPPQGPAGLLGTIRRLFSFAPPDTRYDMESRIGPNFAGRAIYTNGTHLPHIDGPSPRSSHFPPQIILPHPNMIHQYPPVVQTIQSRMSNGHPPPPPPPPPSLSTPSRTSNVKNGTSTTTPKPSKKKKKSSSASSTSSTPSKKPTASGDNKWQTNRLTSSSPPTQLSSGYTQPKSSTTTTAKPLTTNKTNSHYNGSHANRGASNRNVINMNKKTSFTPSTPFKENNNKAISQMKGNSHSHDLSSRKTTAEVILNKRIVTTSDKQDHQSSKPAPKLDMFQTILGSTRSVLNYFKATEGRKSLGTAPTVLEPRSAPTNILVESKSLRKRRSLVGSSHST